MKKFIFILFILAMTIALIWGINLLLITILTPSQDSQLSSQPLPQAQPQLPVQAASPYVSYNGWLKVDGTQIKNEKGDNFVLQGISSHGLQWYSDILTNDNLKKLKETWDVNTFRIAMYTSEGGYIYNKEETKQKLITIANNVIDLDMYVIIDWHILSDNNPNIYKEDSKAFFEEISTLYKDTPNVIYEICNEPNGDSITWDNDVKPYAEEIIPIIRKNSPNSLIIVGTPNWCQKLKPSVQNPLNYKNILYSCHFYAGTHKQELRDEVSYALENGLPVIISEWGTTDASGNGQVDVDESKTWIDFLKRNNISFINWSFSNKNESSALLKSDFNNQKDFNSYLTESGNLVKSLLKSN